jgi:solute carrier family 25 iron transporter 28/37
MEWEERDSSISLLNHCIAGSIAGIIEHLALYPVDTIKTHLQVARHKRLRFTNTAKILYQEEGFLRFWKGANVVASGCIPAHSAQFCIYEVLKDALEFNNDEFNIFKTASIGAASTIGHDAFQAPSDLIK